MASFLLSQIKRLLLNIWNVLIKEASISLILQFVNLINAIFIGLICPDHLIIIN